MFHARIARLALLFVAAGALGCLESLPAEPPPPPPAPAPTLRAPDWSPPAREADPHTLEVHLKPVLDGGEVSHVDVSLRFSEPPGEFAEPTPLVLVMPQREDGEGGWPDAVEDVTARDAEGALALRSKPLEGGEPRVEWRSERRPVGAVSVGYRVRLARAEAGKIMGARAQAGGFQGTGGALLMLPETADAYRVRLAWDLAAAGEGARAVSSLRGEDGRLPLDRLRGAVLAAGPLGRLSVDGVDAEGGRAAFEGAWLGRTGFDPVEALAWAARAHARARALFHDADAAPFTFFVRAAPGLGATLRGAARPGGVLVLAGEELGWGRAARFGAARALVQRWIGGAERGLHFDGPEGASRWITAGLGAHFARELLLRGGLATPEEAADDLLEHVERHARSALRELPGDALAQRLAEPEAQREAEDRGLLHAADVDAAVRARSGGKRSLDDLVLALLERARAQAHEAGATAALPAGAWRELVGAEAGPEAQARLDAFGRGQAVTPPDGAFGPCFKAAKKRIGAAMVTVWAREAKVPAAACARGAR